MFITNLALTNYRSYANLELALNTGISIFVGKNGEGKTNIAESILYLTFLNSHRVSSNAPLVKLGNSSAYVRAKVKNPEREILIELEINTEKANRAKVNQNPVRSQKEIFGLVQSVYFSPEDLDIVRGDPAERRRFIDQLLTLRSPRTAAVISDYERAVRQRNSLLKSRANNDALAPWDKQVSELGGELIALRIAVLKEIQPIFNNVYKVISATKPATILYKSSIESPTEIAAENSQKILEKLLTNLDDVFSELDEERRDHLAVIAKSAAQTIITVAVESDLPESLKGEKYLVKSGSVTKL
ncbi:MAG: DNA replication and repair protein RecF [Actinobacteria bacterium]|nr:DNA replication and repair protein RecF [Actinomycetota bacterium]